jgi:hypothetical protein
MVGTSFDTATTALMNKMIVRAENEVDKYLSKRYDIGNYLAMSLTALPPLLTSLTEDLAEGYYFYRNSRGGGKDSVAYGKELIEGAQANLQLLLERKADLLDVNGDPVAEFANASYQLKSSTRNYPQTTNEDDELLWKQSSDKLDDIESERN